MNNAEMLLRAFVAATISVIAAAPAPAQTTIYPPSGTGGSYVVYVLSDGYASGEEFLFDRAVDGLVVNGLMANPFYAANGTRFTIRKWFKPVGQSGQTQFGITPNYDISKCYIDYDPVATAGAVVGALPNLFFEKVVIVGNLEGSSMGCTPRNNIWTYVTAGAREMGGVLEHEMGHLVAGLLDEYYLFETQYAGPPGPPVDGPNCSTNVSPATPVWHSLFPGATNEEGCNFFLKGIVRPFASCMMRAPRESFCSVCERNMTDALADRAMPPPSVPTNLNINSAGLMLQGPPSPASPAQSNNRSLRLVLQITDGPTLPRVLGLSDVTAPLIDRTRRVGNVAYAIRETGKPTITGVIPGDPFEARPYGNTSAPHLRQQESGATATLVVYVPDATRDALKVRDISITFYRLNPTSGRDKVTWDKLQGMIESGVAQQMAEVPANMLKAAAENSALVVGGRGPR